MARIIILLLIHLIGDLFFQGSKLSRLKASKIPALLEHTGIYTFILTIFSAIWLSLTPLQSVTFGLVNGVLHFIVDFFTSKLKKKYWSVNEERYFTLVGIDQFLHIVILFITYFSIFPNILDVPSIFG